MPDRLLVKDFVALVEAGEYIAALQRFYHPDAVVWENQQQSRTGLEALIENENRVLETFETVTARTEAIAIEGDQVFIHWRFDFYRDNTHVSLDEVSIQHWLSEKIARERFY